MIKLFADTIDNNDIDQLIDWLKTYPRLTKSVKTIEFEDKWSKWLGVKHSIFCNSGSSANLLMLYALLEAGYISADSKVVVPSSSWATDLSPVIQLGLKPVLCDANLDNFSVDLKHLEQIFKDENPSTLILVSVLGLVPDMDEISKLCKKYDVILIEDVCESLGSKHKDKKLGTFGVMSSFSTYFGHHISTIEGGIISTDDNYLFNILKSIRSHGWDRDMDDKYKSSLRKEWNISEFDSLYTFYYSGFNMRSTDLQAYIGINQIDKIDKSCKIRNKNYDLYHKLIKNDYWKPKRYDDRFVSNFAYPVIHPKRDEIVKKLQDNDIEVRPMICGSMGTQPFYVKRYGKLSLPNVSIIDKFGFYIPNHTGLSGEDVKFISKIINKEIQ